MVVVAATTLMTAHRGGTDMSLVSSSDGDSLPSLFFALPMGNHDLHDSTSVVPSSLGRESLERRRNRQTKEHVKVLGMLESMDDDESYVDSTLESLEYSTSNTTLLFQDIVESTAPYNMPRWKFTLRRWTKKIVTEVSHRRLLLKYGPWVMVLVVYAACRFVWYRSTLQMLATSDTDRITLHSHREAMRQQDLSARMSARSDKNGIFLPTESPLDKNLDARKIDADLIAEQQVLQRHRVDIEKPHDEEPMSLADNAKEQRKRESISVESQHQHLRQKQPQRIPDKGDEVWSDFQGRVDKIKELSEQGLVSLTSGVGPVSQFLLQQQQQQQPKHQQFNEKAGPAQMQSHQQELHKKNEPSGAKHEADVYWKPRKRSAKKDNPSWLISAELQKA